jgi:molybdopterin molybdotransferase
MLSVDDALRLVEEHTRSLPPTRVLLSEAAGLVLAEDVTSDVDSPPHDKSMMDGYAVVSGDQASERQVIEEIAAGAVPTKTVHLGSASRIMTGAPIPSGADCVVPVEQTELLGDRVRILSVDLSQGVNILRRGCSVAKGDVVVRRGATIRPVEIGILAEAGRAEVSVTRRPRMAILATGDELVQPHQIPEAGKIRNSNGPLLLAAANSAGAAAIDLGIARDNLEDLREHVRTGLLADVLVLSGGVSAGKFDLVPQVLAEFGVRQVFHKVALRPGKPLWFGVRDAGGQRTLVFGLPGNPVSSFVCFELFVRPAIAALGGNRFAGLRLIRARLTHAFRHPGGRAACLPASVAEVTVAKSNEKTPEISILDWQGSADLAALANANALIRLPANSVEYDAGAILEAFLI